MRCVGLVRQTGSARGGNPTLVMSSYKAFERAMKNKGSGGTIVEARDALYELLKRPDLVTERRGDIDIDFIIEVNEYSSTKCFTMRELIDSLNGYDYYLVSLMRTYLHVDKHANRLQTRETTLPNVVYDQKDSANTHRLVEHRYTNREIRLELLEQYPDGSERMLSPIAYNNDAPEYESKEWVLNLDLTDFGAAVWTLIGLILDRRTKQKSTATGFADKCMLSSLR